MTNISLFFYRGSPYKVRPIPLEIFRELPQRKPLMHRPKEEDPESDENSVKTQQEIQAQESISAGNGAQNNSQETETKIPVMHEEQFDPAGNNVKKSPKATTIEWILSGLDKEPQKSPRNPQNGQIRHENGVPAKQGGLLKSLTACVSEHCDNVRQENVSNGIVKTSGKYIIIRCLMVSTDQADPGCFYFRIS